jgi:hypothetical protein
MLAANWQKVQLDIGVLRSFVCRVGAYAQHLGPKISYWHAILGLASSHAG